jgi:hypothetical protein
MRLCLLSLGFGLTTACGLSMNPDLPSTEENQAPPFDSGPTESPPPNDDISVGDGALPLPPGFESSAGSGGSSTTNCTGLGGEGGANSCGGIL